MTKKSTFLKTLGPISVSFIESFLKRGQVIFTVDQAWDVYGKTRQQTTDFLRDLANKGVIARIKPGLYLILQLGQEETQLTNWPVIAQAIAMPDDYYISHLGAMRLHGMTTHPLYDVYITITKRKKAYQVSNINYHFIYTNPKYFWGMQSHWVSKQKKVILSDIERTILDGFDRPELCGGVKDVVRGIWAVKKNVDWDKLVVYAKKFRTKAAVKRLGYVLELLNLGNQILSSLQHIISGANDYVLLDPNEIDQGRYVRRWRVRVNIKDVELTESIWA